MILFEALKIFIKKFGVALVLIAIFLKIIISIFSVEELSFDNKMTEYNYYSYMETVEGYVTVQKEEFFLAEKEKILAAKASGIDLSNKLANGFFENDTDFINAYNELLPILNKEAAFQIIEEKYNYALADKTKRHILSHEIPFIAVDFPDIALVFFIVLFTSLVFLDEDATKMIVLLKTSKNGQHKTFFSKCFIVFGSIFFMWAVFAMIEFIFIFKHCNFNLLSAPIQSMRYYENSLYDISFIKLIFLINITKLIGYIFLGAVSVLLSVKIKKPLLTIFIPISAIFLQQFTFSKKYLAYYLPTGLLRASGYFKGKEYLKVGNEILKDNVVFNDIPFNTLLFIIAITIFMSFTFIYLSLSSYKNKMKKSNYKAVFMCIFSVLCLSGCTGDNNPLSTNFNFNESFVLQQNEDYYYVYENQLKSVSKESNEEFNILRDVFIDESIWSFCLFNENCYYMHFESNSTSIGCVSLKDFSQSVLFEADDKPAYEFLGIVKKKKQMIDQIILGFFTDERNLYLITDNPTCIYQYNLKTKKLLPIIEENIYKNNVSFDGENVYYVNSHLKLNAYNVNTKKTQRLSEKNVRTITLKDNVIYFSDINGTYKYDILNDIEIKLNDYVAQRISATDNHVIFTDKNRILHSYNIVTNECKEIYSQWIVDFSCILDTNTVYIKSFDNSSFIYEIIEY